MQAENARRLSHLLGVPARAACVRRLLFQHQQGLAVAVLHLGAASFSRPMSYLGFPFADLGRLLSRARDARRVRCFGDFDLELSRDADRLRSGCFGTFNFAIVTPCRFGGGVHRGG